MNEGPGENAPTALVGTRCVCCGSALIYADCNRAAVRAICPPCCSRRMAEHFMSLALRLAFPLAGLEYAIRALERDQTTDVRPRLRDVAQALDELRGELAANASRS